MLAWQYHRIKGSADALTRRLTDTCIQSNTSNDDDDDDDDDDRSGSGGFGFSWTAAKF
jgi:hypothetical protein